VERFVKSACERLGSPLGNLHAPYTFNPSPLPVAVREQIPITKSVRIAFDFPVAEGVTHVGRTSDLVEAISDHLVGTVLDDPDAAVASRCGAIRTGAVSQRTTLLLLRVRMHIDTTRGSDTTSL